MTTAISSTRTRTLTRCSINALGPKQPLFALIADLAAHHHLDLLQMLYSGESALHATLSDDTRFGQHQDFTGRSGAPFVPGERGPSHALRVLAGLGPVLAQEPPPEEPLRAAVGWYQEARGSLPSRSWRWSTSPCSPGTTRMCGGGLKLVAQVAGRNRDDGAVPDRSHHPASPGPSRWARPRPGGAGCADPQPAIGVLFDAGRRTGRERR